MHNLTKEDGDNPLDGIAQLDFGLAWEKIADASDSGFRGKIKGKIREQQGLTDEADLDAGAVFFVGSDPVDYIGFGNQFPLKDEDTPAERNSARHSGDSVKGEGDGDDESISLSLLDLPSRFSRVMMLCGAYKKGSDIAKVRGIRASVYDATGGSKDKVALIQPSLLQRYDMLALADVKRTPTGWVLAVNGAGFNLGRDGKGDITRLLRSAISVLG
jgi:tellurium resistance protein TerZ